MELENHFGREFYEDFAPAVLAYLSKAIHPNSTRRRTTADRGEDGRVAALV